MREQKKAESTCFLLPRPGGTNLPVPTFDNTKLLIARSAWPPSCYVGDATDKEGRFWWRSRIAVTRLFSSKGLRNALLPWPIYMIIMAAESGIMTAVVYRGLERWAEAYFKPVVVMHMVWYFFSGVWVSIIHNGSEAERDDDFERDVARKALSDNSSAAGGRA
eukprot:evm.model.scf_716.10 EVM.evm.TU.scf_716.10   scf_716:56808-58130(-)